MLDEYKKPATPCSNCQTVVANVLRTMVLRKIFPTLYTLPGSAAACSRNATLYLLRCVFYMGIRTPPRNYFLVYCLWSAALNLSSTFYQPIGFMTGYISHFWEFAPGDCLTSLQVAFNAWSCSTKVIIVWILVKRFDEALLVLDEMDKRLTQPAERIKVHRAVAQSNRIFFTFMAVYMFYATSTFLSAVSTGRPPYQNYYPLLDWKADRLQFWVQAGLEYFAMLGACFQDVCVDCYPINFILPLRAHMSSFAVRLRQLGTDPHAHPDETYEQLVQCIQDHKIILR